MIQEPSTCTIIAMVEMAVVNVVIIFSLLCASLQDSSKNCFRWTLANLWALLWYFSTHVPHGCCHDQFKAKGGGYYHT